MADRYELIIEASGVVTDTPPTPEPAEPVNDTKDQR